MAAEAAAVAAENAVAAETVVAAAASDGDIELDTSVTTPTVVGTGMCLPRRCTLVHGFCFYWSFVFVFCSAESKYLMTKTKWNDSNSKPNKSFKR